MFWFLWFGVRARRVDRETNASKIFPTGWHDFRAFRDKDQAMEIEGTTFGTITIDGKTYEHDVIIRLSGEVVKRKKKLSKKYYGTSHVLSKDEAKFVFEKGCEQLILSGQMGNVHLSPEAEAYFAKMRCKVLLPPPKRSRCSTGQMQRRSGFFT
jgi:hypothetical protein